MWNYRCHTLLQQLVYPIIYFFNFVLELSWLYAHYRNGSFPYQYPNRPRLTFKNWSFMTCVREAWHNRKGDDHD